MTRAATRLLSRCLSGALGQPLTVSDLPANQPEWEKMLRSSSAHLAAPQLRWALREQGLFSVVPADVAEYLDAVYTLNLERNRQCEDQLADLMQSLNGIGIRPVLLKGAAAIVSELYPTSGERMFIDLDILIPVRDLPKILEKLGGADYSVWLPAGMDAPPDPVEFSDDHHYLPLVNSSWPASVELHVHPVDLSFTDLLSGAEVFRDASIFRWRGAECLLPSPTHFIAHNFIHGFLNDTRQLLKPLSLRQLFEFSLVSQRFSGQIDWEAIRNRFDQHAYGTAFRQYLALAEACFDFPVPSGIPMSGRDRPNIQLYMTHLDLESRAALWTINLVRQLKKRLIVLRRAPGRSLRKLFTSGLYTRLIDSIFGPSRN